MPVSRTELVAILVITFAGFAARFALLGELAVEHFDEGVYSSNLWFPDEGYQYPDRFLYAPPLVPSLIEWSMIIFGPARWVPFLPSLILGSLTVPLAWWSVRRWANGSSGVAAAVLVSLSDFHIAMSRSALTDAPMVFFLLLAVWLAVEALSDRNLRLAAVAGFSTGLAWATKYNGWLPLAIAISGAGAAWIFWPRGKEDSTSEENSLPASSVVVCLAVIGLTAAVTWFPVWWDLQPIGGYARVADNHRNYVTGLTGWWSAVVRHEAVQRHYASWPTLVSGWLAVVSAALVLRVERSTWNDQSPGHDGSKVSASGVVKRGVKRSTWNDGNDTSPPLTKADSVTASPAENRSTWNGSGFVFTVVISAALAGAIVLSPLVVLGVWALIELVASVMTMRRTQTQRISDSKFSHADSTQRKKSKATPGEKPAAETGYRRHRTWFATWLHLAWLCGLLLATPLYRPYPRLVLPLLCVGHLATGMAIVRLLGGNLLAGRSPATIPAEDTSSPLGEKTVFASQVEAADSESGCTVVSSRPAGLWVRFLWLLPATMLCMWRAVAFPAVAWQDRSSLSVIADQAIVAATENCAGESGITADISFVVYVYGEPGLFFHSPRDGVPVQPIMDLSFARPGSDHPRVPTFVLAGPHAWQSSQFGEQYRELPDGSLIEVAEFPYRVSDFVLLDDHSPRQLSKHRNDVVKLYRVQFR